MSLRAQQSKFTKAVGILIGFAYQEGYELTWGDTYPHRVHKKNSKHNIGLAIDLNLFRDGQYLDATEDHNALGEYWESIGGIWGGRFKDGNHYEWPEDETT